MKYIYLSLVVLVACSPRPGSDSVTDVQNGQRASSVAVSEVPALADARPRSKKTTLSIAAARVEIAAHVTKAGDLPAGDKWNVLEITASGEIRNNGKIIGSVTASGVFIDGKNVTIIQPDGHVQFTHTMSRPIPRLHKTMIDANGSIHKDGDTLLSIGINNDLTGIHWDKKGRYVGPASSRRAMMFVLLTATLPPPVGIHLPYMRAGPSGRKNFWH